MHEYLSDILRVPATNIVVRKPNEPTEEYQTQMDVAKKSEYRNKLQDIEYYLQQLDENYKFNTLGEEVEDES